MNTEEHIAGIAALIGDPMRVKILWTMLDGRAFTATELAISVDTSPQNLSMHLAKLIKADLLSVEVQGRHRYYTFSRPEVGYVLEAMAGLLPGALVEKVERLDTDQPIRHCRTCYDHLAGKIGVLITESLVRQQFMQRSDAVFEVTAKGERWFAQLDIDCEALRQQRRTFARVCLDWTERRPHLAGSLGAALLQKMRAEQWIRPIANSRAVLVTPKGQKEMSKILKIEV